MHFQLSESFNSQFCFHKCINRITHAHTHTHLHRAPNSSEDTRDSERTRDMKHRASSTFDLLCEIKKWRDVVENPGDPLYLFDFILLQ